MSEDDLNISNGENDLVCVLRTADIAQLTVVKSILDSAGIPYTTQGEEGLRMIPLVDAGGFFGGNVGGAAIHVHRQDLEDVLQLLQEIPIEEDDERQDD